MLKKNGAWDRRFATPYARENQSGGQGPMQVADQAELERRLAKTLGAYDARPDTNGVSFALASPSRGWEWEWDSADHSPQYFIASTTKLYVTALVMQLRSEGRLDLDTPAAHYLGPGVMAGLHVLQGVDSSERITVRELLAHTSGIGDYFEQRRADGSTQIGDALRDDFGWDFADVLRIARGLTPQFPPSSPGKAFYSDTNYQLLGAVVEAVDGVAYEEALRRRILEPLGLRRTYPFTRETLDRYGEVDTMLYGTKPVTIPLAMASVRADGGIVSTTADGIAFLRAFMDGRLFPAAYLDEMLRDWRPIFPPLEYGVGVMRFALPRYYTLFTEVPPMVGHSGASGAVLYHVPKLDLYISGTVNQIKKRSLSYNLMTRLVMACQTHWATGKR
ncbi:MAG: serine hydrolase domain-containing protein [Coriobacteriia bacterium]|nr:serine hydrolase domain-containing protein [Coriobacteriia bacterium]